MTLYEFFVPGIPRPGGSKRAFVVQPKGGGKPRAVVTEDCARSKDWRTSVAFAASSACPMPLAGPLEVVVAFVLPRPRGHYGTGKNADQLRRAAPTHPTGKPDATKLWRSTEDALKGIAWYDDAQVVKQTVSKGYAIPGHAPGAYITIAER